MDIISVSLGIILYFIFLVFVYIFIIKRLKNLNDKHVNYTKVEWLQGVYKSLKKIIFVLFIILFVLSIFIILKFIYV